MTQLKGGAAYSKNLLPSPRERCTVRRASIVAQFVRRGLPSSSIARSTVPLLQLRSRFRPCLRCRPETLVAVLWENDKPNRVRLEQVVENHSHPVLIKAERQLGEYFEAKRRSFSVALDMRGTPFQRNVWEALLAIPFGETRSYRDLARKLGNPQATRAVGAANGKNPVSIIVPCHRVIGSDGKPTGFAGGLETKARLLELEQAGRSL